MPPKRYAIYSLPRFGEPSRRLGEAHQEHNSLLVILEQLPTTNGFTIVGLDLVIEVAVLPPTGTLGQATKSITRPRACPPPIPEQSEQTH